MAAKAHKQLESKYCDLGDVRIAYNEYGQGPTLLLLHPNSFNKDFWYPHRTTWLSDFHTIALDARGHGESVSEDSVLTYEMLGQDIAAFCDKMALEGCSVLGYSDGAVIGLYLAASRPGYFRKIAAISPNLNYEDIRISWKIVFSVIGKIIRLLSHFSSGMKRIRRSGSMMHMKEYLPNVSLYGVGSELHVFYGEKDVASDSHYMYMKSLMPNADFKKYMGCTHANIINSSEVQQAVLEVWRKS